MSRFDHSRTLRLVAGSSALLIALLANAAQTDLSNLPLSSSSNLQVKPNVMFILDDSASMGSNFMPDGVGSKKNTVGFRNAACNLVYYNPDPSTDYVVPKTSLGGPINPPTPNAVWGTNGPTTFNAALDDGFYYFDGGTATPVNLGTSFKSHFSDSAQPAYYWSYLGSATLTPLSADCNMTLTSESDAQTTEICANGLRKTGSATCPTSNRARWRKVLVSASSGVGNPDERERFANWFSYYRTRLNMMKSASGRAIVPLSESYRVGFMTIDPGAPVSADKFLPVEDFTPDNKAAWFIKLYSQKVNNQTPLLMALSRAGRYYAGKTDGINEGITDDPVQFSCQQNFTILTTDGYWNQTPNGGKDINGADLASNQDGDLNELDAYNEAGKKFLVSPHPLYDGAVRFNWQTAAIEYRDNTACTYPQRQKQTTQWQTQTVQWEKTTVQNQQQTTQLKTRTTQLQKTSTQRQQRTIQWQERTVKYQKRTTQLQKRTSQQYKVSTQLQQTTSQIKKRTVQYQSQITQRQKRVEQLQKRTARFRACAGDSGTGSCVDVTFDCSTAGTGDPSKPYCYITGSGNTDWADATSCTPVQSETSQTLCRTTDTGWQDVASCTQSSGSTKVSCRNSVTQAWQDSTAASCPNKNFDANGVKYECRIKSNSDTTVNSASCTESDTGTGPTVTCSTVKTGPANVASCTAHDLNASGYPAGETVTCSTTASTKAATQYCAIGTVNGEEITDCPTDDWSGYSNLSATACPASPSTTGVLTECTTTNPAYVDTASCTPVAINSSGQTVECKETTVVDWHDVATCTASAGIPAVECSTTSDSGWGNVGICTASGAGVMPTVTCQTTSAATVDASTCAIGAVLVAGVPTGETITACPTTNPGWNNTGTCSPGTIDSSGRTVECATTAASAWTNVGTCATGTDTTTGVTVTACQEASKSTTPVGACNPASPPNGPIVTCDSTVLSAWQDSGKCNESSADPGPTVMCRAPVVSTWQDDDNCKKDDAAQPSVSCRTVQRAGHQLEYRTKISSSIFSKSGQEGISYGTTAGTPSGWTTTQACSATAPTLPPNGPVPAAIPPIPPLPAGSTCTRWPCETPIPGNGSNISLADVAQYYYKTDLRTPDLGNCGTSPLVCDNDLKPLGTGPEADKATWQHMTTFTLGLGVSGSLTYQSNYKTSSTGDFADLRTGAKEWPVPVINQASFDKDLVTPSHAIDDLWHAAVDGRGQYFAADSPANVVSGLGKALNDVDAAAASGSGAAVSSQQLMAAGNLAFVTTYLTKKWTGNIQALNINAATGALEGTPVWDAQAKLDAATSDACDERKIKLFRQGATNNLVDFAASSASTSCTPSGKPALSPMNASELANFGATQVMALSQYPSMTAAQRAAAEGAKMVNYLRGQRGNETFTAGDVERLFRARDNVLGDIVYAAPKYVQAPFAGYDDKGYATYKANQFARTPMVYVAANDGMLHAFNASSDPLLGGVETWAFVPSTVLPNLHKIASEGYGNEHVFNVDGTPASSDVCASDCDQPNATWKTILVGGFRAGGKGYYALDITDPATPKALWELKASTTCFDPTSPGAQHSDCHLGYSYGVPVVAKLRDGRWVVFVSSGYNNVNVPPIDGDGQGYLYILDAMTGRIINKIATGAGDATSPSGLANINARSIETLRDNTADFVYGTDLLGNIWRFDVNDMIVPSGVEASLVARLLDSSGTPQAITTAPQLGVVNNEPYVYVATGRYLGSSDLLPPTSTQTQTIWAIKDPINSTPADESVPSVDNLRGTLKRITTVTVGGETSTTAFRTNSCANVNTDRCDSTAGWFTDLPATGERVNIEMKLDLGTLVVASNVPPTSACEIGGTSWINFFDASSGLHVANSTNGSTGSRVLDSKGRLTQVVGLNIIRTITGQVVVQATTAGGEIATPYVAFSTPLPTGKRVSWREIVR